ncbi:uncharacterized protein LOC116258856 [Nymphaea colorata]|uniref:uncharacterized protein LOC116258856 n=1 Tax=Nymphaea colorata TaxID=210225 RepID=UPI00129D8F04|nr:uncharacterized protein LOC116258856 [Nymphaea colorata]
MSGGIEDGMNVCMGMVKSIDGLLDTKVILLGVGSKVSKAILNAGNGDCLVEPISAVNLEDKGSTMVVLDTRILRWTLTSLVQSMVSKQRSHASSTGDTTAPSKEKATVVSFKQFMSMLSSIFTEDSSLDKAEEWIGEIEHIFELLKMPEGDKVNYGSYRLKGDAKKWWQSTREILFTDQQSIPWKQFRDSFFSTYFLVHARNKKMQEFLELQQNQLSLQANSRSHRHLEAYSPHIYTTNEARADKFVHGLCDGLRREVISSRPCDLDEAVTMDRCMKEDWARTQKDHHKKARQHSNGGRTQVKHRHFTGRAKPYEGCDDQTFRRNRPNRNDATQGQWLL